MFISHHNQSNRDQPIRPTLYMETETMVGQHHRRGVVWLVKGLGRKGSQVQILGETPFSKVSVSNKTVYIQTCWVRVNMIIPLNLENVYLFTYLLPLVLLTDEREDIQKKTFTKWVNAQLAKVRQLYFHSAFNSV